MHRRSRLLVAAVAVTMLAPLAACRSTEGDGSGEGKTLNVLTLQDPFFYAIEELLPEFEEETGVDVNLEGVDYDTLLSRATNSFVSEQGDIDVIAPDSMWLSRFAENGWLAPLDDRISEDADEVDIEDFIPSSLYTLSEWKGSLYTLPAATYGTAVLYRPSVFKELGIEPPPAEPSEDWTWDDYMRTVKAIDGETVDGTEMNGTVVLGAGPQPITHMWSQIAASKGARWVEAFPDAAEWSFEPTFTDEPMVESLDYYKELYEYSPEEAINYLWFDAGTRFGSGDIGMMYHWTPYAYLVQRTEYMGNKESKVVGDYALGALPVEPGVEQTNNIGGFAFGIGGNSEEQDLAWEFVKWASSAETQKEMALLDMRQFSDFSRESLYSDEDLLDAYPYLPTQLEVIRGGNGKVVRPPVQNYSTLEQTIGNALNEMLVNDGDAADTAQQIQDGLEETLTEEEYIPWEGESYEDTPERNEELMAELGP